MARLGWTGLLATIVFVSAVAVTAPTEHEQHSDHGHAATGAALVSQMQLNESRRWPTDASLRSGMPEIRTVFDAHHPRIHAGTQSDAQYDELSTLVVPTSCSEGQLQGTWMASRYRPQAVLPVRRR